jgi:hypothetical protein
VREDEISERKREVNDFNNVPPDLFMTFKNLYGNICPAKRNHIGSEEKKGDNKRGLFINS